MDYHPPKRSAFYKIGYNPHHIPNESKYNQQRKKPLPQWEKPIHNWPPRIPRPTMHRGKTLLSHIDSEENKRIQDGRKFEIPNYRSGDVLDVTLYNSLSEGKFHTQRGIVIGSKMRNNLRHSFTFHAVGDDTHFSYMVKVNSPLLANVQVYKYGSNKNRKKLNYIPDLELPPGKVTEPIIKGKNYKKRSELGMSKETKQKT